MRDPQHKRRSIPSDGACVGDLARPRNGGLTAAVRSGGGTECCVRLYLLCLLWAVFAAVSAAVQVNLDHYLTAGFETQ